jgi:Arc/MetJ family transcription regulator
MRTNIDIDEALIERVLAVTGLRTKREAVDHALRELLRLHGQREIRGLRGKVRWEGEIPPPEQG